MLKLQPAEETHELQADDQDPSTNRKLRRIVEGFYLPENELTM
jgi:hypothetical protein